MFVKYVLIICITLYYWIILFMGDKKMKKNNKNNSRSNVKSTHNYDTKSNMNSNMDTNIDSNIKSCHNVRDNMNPKDMRSFRKDENEDHSFELRDM